MKTFALSIILGLNAIISHAAPSPVQQEARQAIDFYLDCTGATGSYQVEFVLPSEENFYNFNITNPLSVSTCILGGPGFCGLSGADGGEFNVNGGNSVDIGPPQALTGAVCTTS